MEYNRLVWLVVRGMPVGLWDSKIFNSIGERFGIIVQPSEASVADGCLTFEKMALIVNSGKKIAEEVIVVWKGSEFKVWVSGNTAYPEGSQVWPAKSTLPENVRSLEVEKDMS